jgi:hypothetical protein
MSEDYLNQLNAITTSCKTCAFAHYIGNTQVSCDLDRLSHFTKSGVEILEVEDHEKEFYVINNALCTAFRSASWAEVHKGSDLKEVYKKETIPRIGFMLLIEEKKDEDELFSDIAKTVKNISDSLARPPRYMIIISNLLNADLDYLNLVQYAQELFSEYDIDHKVHKILDHVETSLEMVDAVFTQHAKNGFYCVLRAGDTVIENMDQILHHAINTELMDVGMVKGDDEVSMVTVQSVLHKHLHGNLEHTLESKIENIQNEDGSKTSLIYTWDELSDVFTKSNSSAR